MQKKKREKKRGKELEKIERENWKKRGREQKQKKRKKKEGKKKKKIFIGGSVKRERGFDFDAEKRVKTTGAEYVYSRKLNRVSSRGCVAMVHLNITDRSGAK